MKKIISLSAIIMIAISTFTQTAEAQIFSLAPSAGLSLDQNGLVRKYDPVIGLTAMMGLGPKETSMSALAVHFDGGNAFRTKEIIRTKDNKSDSTAYQVINAPSVMLWGMICIPQGGDEDGGGETNKFAGPVFGIGYGMAFPDQAKVTREPGNIFKIFLQANYCIKDGGKVRITTFVRPALNVLYSRSTTTGWDMSGGFAFTLSSTSNE